MPPIYLLVKPASGNCNMRCEYCFYADEIKRREIHNYGIMTLDTLDIIMKKVLAHATGSCSFAFQGGEPTLAGIDYYRAVLHYANQYNVNHCELHYSIQTNGYNINEQWAAFFAQNHFLVGISLDGDEPIHNQYRKDAQLEGTFFRVMDAIALFKEYGVMFNILTVVHKETVENISQIYNFFRRNDLLHQQYIECLDPIGEEAGHQPYSLTPQLYEKFLKGLFGKWYRDMVKGKYVSIRYFENLLLIMQGKQPESCNMMGRCSRQTVIEADGSVYPCDFYALDEWKLGNLRTDNIPAIDRKRKELKFVEQSKPVPSECKKCKWFVLCRNGCRRSCEPVGDYIRGKNYFCQAYKGFFEYAFSGLQEILELYTS